MPNITSTDVNQMAARYWERVPPSDVLLRKPSMFWLSSFAQSRGRKRAQPHPRRILGSGLPLKEEGNDPGALARPGAGAHQTGKLAVGVKVEVPPHSGQPERVQRNWCLPKCFPVCYFRGLVWQPVVLIWTASLPEGDCQ